MLPREITAEDFLEHTRPAVSMLFDAIGKEEIRFEPIKNLLQTKHKMRYWDFINADLNDDFDEIQIQSKFVQAAETRMQALLVSQSIEVLCGSVFQIAKQGMSLILKKSDRYIKGRKIGTQYLSNVIWHGRNQAMHWEDGPPTLVFTKNCFKTLEKEFGNKFDFGTSPQNMAFVLWSVIDWNSYDDYLKDMKEILK